MNSPVRLLGILGAASTVALSLAASSCGHRSDDINRVQPGYVKKSMFLDSEWHYRRTIVKSETTNEFAIEGQGDIWMDRVRFDIQEDWLIARRAYEAIPGSQTGEYDGKGQFEGSVLAAWPIRSHFDIQRNYDPITGNEFNVINENNFDRHWYEREYMRVDFSQDGVERSFTAARGVFDFPLNIISTGSEYRHCQEYETEPFCSRFTQDTVDIVDQVYLGMDLINCAAFVGYSYSGYQNCGFGKAMVRHNFTRVKEESDYIPRNYPDSIVRKGADGKPLYDEESGEVLREPFYDRFGIFRLEIPTYDRGYGTTESGRLFRAMIFNLWENHTDGRGNVIPMSERTPQPVIYYLNAEYPPRWRQAAREVAAEYDKVLTSLVRDITGKDPGFPMFEIRDNDCNETNIRSFVSTNPDLRYAVERVVCKSGQACDDPLSLVGIGNLTTVCTSLENATRDPDTGLPGFDWQRIGDSQWKMVVWLSNPQQSGWGGYGPMHADGRTGEAVSASSFLRGFTYEVSAATIVDYIEFINDEVTVEETIYGQVIRRQALRTLQRATAMSNTTASPAAVDKIARRLSRLGTTKEELLPEIDPNFQTHRLQRASGTRIESDHLMNDLHLIIASREGKGWPNKWRPGDPVDEELYQRATPAGWIETQNPLSTVRDRTRRALAAAGFCFLDHDFDPQWAGLALELKDLTREQRYEIVGNMMIKHVLLHELGHNFGLSHNFEGSYDALNYFDEFWDNHWADDSEKLRNRYDEKRNTTVMEYMSAKGAFTDRLGKYDEAAIRFAYANQIQVFDKQVDGGFDMREWRYRGDYRLVPDYVCAGSEQALESGTRCASPDEARAEIRARSWVDFDPQNPPENEVPYLFCDNFFDRRTPFCATFDYGSSQREIFANYYSMWRDYFFFNNFIRDRLVPITWSPSRAMMATYYAMIHWATVGQYLYFLRIYDPDFTGSDLEADMVATVGHGLNFASEVMGTPEPGRFCPWPGTTDPQVFIPWFYLNDCDPYAAINSQYALDAEAIHLPLGPARPATLGFTDDFIDFDLSFIGSYFDKYNVLWLLGLVRNNLFIRFDMSAEPNRFNYSLFRILEPEIRGFYDKLIRLDPFLIQQSVSEDLGSYWCRDPENPTAAHMGHFEPRQMVDPATFDPAGAPPACEGAALIHPRLLFEMPFSAMFFAHALFSSEVDNALDMGKSMKVYAVGSDDEFPEWRNLPPDEVCSCQDGLTQIDYRAVRQPEGIPDIGCRLVDRACEAQNAYYNDPQSDYMRDRWRSWMERLEYARDLARVFDSYR